MLFIDVLSGLPTTPVKPALSAIILPGGSSQGTRHAGSLTTHWTASLTCLVLPFGTKVRYDALRSRVQCIEVWAVMRLQAIQRKTVNTLHPLHQGAAENRTLRYKTSYNNELVFVIEQLDIRNTWWRKNRVMKLHRVLPRPEYRSDPVGWVVRIWFQYFCSSLTVLWSLIILIYFWNTCLLIVIIAIPSKEKIDLSGYLNVNFALIPVQCIKN